MIFTTTPSDKLLIKKVLFQVDVLKFFIYYITTKTKTADRKTFSDVILFKKCIKLRNYRTIHVM